MAGRGWGRGHGGKGVGEEGWREGGGGGGMAGSGGYVLFVWRLKRLWTLAEMNVRQLPKPVQCNGISILYTDVHEQRALVRRTLRAQQTERQGGTEGGEL